MNTSLRNTLTVFVFLLTALVPFFCFGQIERVTLEKVGSLKIDTHYFDLDTGAYAYRADGFNGLAIYHIKNKTHPVKIGNFPLAGYISDRNVKTVGNYVYAANDSDLYIIDVSKPKAPQLKGTYSSDVNFYTFFVQGNKVFIVFPGSTCGDSTMFSIVDISNPSNPRKTGEYYDHFIIIDGIGRFNFDISDRYVYTLSQQFECNEDEDYSINLYIVDISNPKGPALINSMYLGYGRYDASGGEIWREDSIIRFARYGNYLFMVHSNRSLQVLDVSNPASPSWIETGITLKDALEAQTSGHFLFVKESKRIVIFDISNPVKPVQKSAWESEHNIGDFKVSDNIMAFQDGKVGRVIIDVSNPSAPKMIRKIPVEIPFETISAISDGYAYIKNKQGDVNMIDISDSSHPSLSGVYDPNSPANYLVSGDTLFAKDENDLRIIDISNKSHPVEVGKLKTKGDFLSLSGDYIYTEEDRQSIRIIDISDKTNPSITGEINLDKYFDSAHVTADNIFIMYHSDNYSESALQIIDISNKAKPTTAGTIIIPRYIRGMEFFGNVAALFNDKGLYLFDISNKYKPVKTAYLKMNNYSGSTSSSNLICMGDDEGIKVIDISNPSNPVVKGQYTGLNRVETLAISGNYLIAMWDYNRNSNMNYYSRIYIFDISNPFNPRLDGISEKFNCSSTGIFFVQGNSIYLANNGALEILKISPNTAAGKSIRLIQPDGSYDFFSLENPNPNRILWLENKISGNVGVDLYQGNTFLMTIAEVPADAGFYDWQLPAKIKSGDNFKIHIHQGKTGDISDSYFHIRSSSDRYKFDEYPYIYSLLKLVGAPGQPSPAKKIHITKEENDNIRNWTIKTSEPWIHVTPASGTGEGEIEISPVITGLIPGVYNGTIALYTSMGIEASLHVRLNVWKTLPTITLSRKNLAFTVSGNNTTPPQTLMVDCGEYPVYWTASSSDYTKIDCDPVFGTRGSAIFTVSLADPYYLKNLPDGISAVEISVNSEEVSNSPQKITVTIDKIKNASLPFGEFSTPANGSTVSGSVPITGWALDDVGIESVKIYRDNNIYIGDAVFVEGCRPDVEMTFPGYPNNYRAGWGYMLLTHVLPGANQVGDGVYTLYAIAKDKEGNEITLGSKTITVNNSASPKPFGAIDTPKQDETYTSDVITNFGWVLTPPPNMIPADGAAIHAVIDGVEKGHAGYNGLRPDIAALFPGYANTDGAGGYFYIDAAKLKNGLHTIAWNVTDNAGNSDGIGSRYFTVIHTITGGDSSVSSDKCLSQYEAPSPSEPNPVLSPIEIKELERIQLPVAGRRLPVENEAQSVSSSLTPGTNTKTLKGYMVVGNELRELPIGSFLDTTSGVFYWQPGPGFIGDYRLEFHETHSNGEVIKKTIDIKIAPRSSFN